MSKNDIKKIVKEFAKLLKKNRIAFKQIYLYGSYASGKAKKHSDIDVAVVVEKVPRRLEARMERKMQLWRLTHKVDNRIEPLLLEQEDLREDTLSIMGDEVREHGILVVSA